FRGRQKNVIRPLSREQPVDRILARQVRLLPRLEDQVVKALALELPDSRRPDKAPMARYKNAIGRFHHAVALSLPTDTSRSSAASRTSASTIIRTSCWKVVSAGRPS